MRHMTIILYSSYFYMLPFKCYLPVQSLVLHHIYLNLSSQRPIAPKPFKHVVSKLVCDSQAIGNVTPHCLCPQTHPVNICSHFGCNWHLAVFNDQTHLAHLRIRHQSSLMIQRVIFCLIKHQGNIVKNGKCLVFLDDLVSRK